MFRKTLQSLLAAAVVLGCHTPSVADDAEIYLADPERFTSAPSVMFTLDLRANLNSQVLGIVLFCLGYPDQALAQSTAPMAEARRLAHPPSLALTLAWGTMLLLLVGNNAVLGEGVDELVAIATEQGFPFYRTSGTICRGWVPAGSTAGASPFLPLRHSPKRAGRLASNRGSSSRV